MFSDRYCQTTTSHGKRKGETRITNLHRLPPFICPYRLLIRTGESAKRARSIDRASPLTSIGR
ncbi:hypothetical protein TYRP_017601 [Tyrophagus putrescentiae]|nr:hypothetical protein TYRP_017601 [Tyrophagus putrescentiae]